MKVSLLFGSPVNLTICMASKWGERTGTTYIMHAKGNNTDHFFAVSYLYNIFQPYTELHKLSHINHFF